MLNLRSLHNWLLFFMFVHGFNSIWTCYKTGWVQNTRLARGNKTVKCEFWHAKFQLAITLFKSTFASRFGSLIKTLSFFRYSATRRISIWIQHWFDELFGLYHFKNSLLSKVSCWQLISNKIKKLRRLLKLVIIGSFYLIFHLIIN